MRIRSLPPLLAAILPLGGCAGLTHAPGAAAGFVAHQLCGGVFVSGQDADAYYREAIAPTASAIAPLVRRRVNRADLSVTANVMGVTRQAVYRGSQGCLVLHGPAPSPAAPPLRPAEPPLLSPIAGADVVEPADPALKAALDQAFAETAAPPHRFTKAVVIVHDGRIIAERYAPGYGVTTPILGWSMTKSVTSALIGVLVREGRLNLYGPAPVAAWSSPSDPRHAVSVDNLLRMTSGLDIGQSLTADLSSAFDPTTRMVFDEPDMAAFADRAPLAFPPGSRWTYTNGNTILLSRIIRDAAGGDAMGFARRELFDKLGTTGVVWETDQPGTPIGASHLWAPARDWARFGLLYLNDGVIGGQRILPEGWADYSARLTPGSETYGYGAGFWTNRGDGDGPHRRVAGGMPADSYMARGAQGQYLVIIPSARLVVLRMGMAYTDRDDVGAVERLVAEAVAAVRTEELR